MFLDGVIVNIVELNEKTKEELLALGKEAEIEDLERMMAITDEDVAEIPAAPRFVPGKKYKATRDLTSASGGESKTQLEIKKGDIVTYISPALTPNHVIVKNERGEEGRVQRTELGEHDVCVRQDGGEERGADGGGGEELSLIHI